MVLNPRHDCARESHVKLVVVVVGDTAIECARADAFQGMMSSGSDLVRLVHLLALDHPILQSRGEVAVEVASRRSAVYQYLKNGAISISACDRR